MKGCIFVVAAGLALAASCAQGQWSDNFDSYATGDINGLGGWQGWAADPVAAGDVSSTFFRSAPNSQRILGAPVPNDTDSVRQYTGVTEGEWRYTAWMYIPEDFTGITYFILNNLYNDGGPWSWSVQMPFDATTGLTGDDLRADAGAAIVRGRWAEIRVEFDLGPNTCSTYYDGVLLSTGEWAIGVPSLTNPLALGGVDLYANGASAVYYDDMNLEYIGPGAGRCPFCPADFNDDGGVDGADIEAFFLTWEAGESCADVNEDGGVDGGDIEEFFFRWENVIC